MTEIKLIILERLAKNEHLSCSCMDTSLVVQKEHPEWLALDSGYNPCYGCGAWTKTDKDLCADYPECLERERKKLEK